MFGRQRSGHTGPTLAYNPLGAPKVLAGLQCVITGIGEVSLPVWRRDRRHRRLLGIRRRVCHRPAAATAARYLHSSQLRL